MSGTDTNQRKQIESLKNQVKQLGDQVKELETLLKETKNLRKNIGCENTAFDLNQPVNREHENRESKYLTLFNSIPVGIYRSTPAGELVEANQALVKMLGFPDRQTLLATKVTDLFVHAEDRLLETRVLSEIGDVRRYELPLKRYDGQIIWVEDYARVVRDENHEIIFYEGSMINISERKQGEVEILNAKEAAEEASRVKGLFLDNMSHEIRTPLNGILGTLDLLCNDELSTNQKDLIEIMQESGRSLLKIVDNILDLDISGSGQLVIKDLPLNLRELLVQEVEKAKLKAVEKKLSLTCMIADEIPGRLLGDGLRIEQVLENLLENAIKFTHSGYVQLQATVKEKTQKGFDIHIRISDTGIGIANHQLNQIFEPFTQADNSHTRQFGGAGLGTSIARKLVEKMGGQIWAQSPNPDSQSGFPGSIFHLVIPLKNGDVTGKKVFKKPGEKIKGLLVEDNVINQKLITRFLNRLGIDVDIVINGLEAVKRVQKNQYDVIFMDIQMPVMNGLEATGRIRKNGFNLPIIAVTAHATKGYREICLQAGMDDYVAKPVHFEHLASVVKKFF